MPDSSSMTVVSEAMQTRNSGLKMVRWTHGIINRLAKSTDMAMLVLPIVLLELKFDQSGAPVNWLQLIVIIGAQIWAYLSVMEGISGYRVEHYQGFWGQFGHVLAGWLVSLLVGGLVLQACLPGYLPEFDWVVSWSGLQLLFIMLGRQGQRLLVHVVERRQLLRRNVVVIGANETGARVLRKLCDPSEAARYNVQAVFSDTTDEKPPEQLGGYPVLRNLEALEAYAQDHTIDLIVIALPWERGQELFRLLHQVEWIAADVVIPFDEGMVAPGYARLAPLARGMGALQVMARPFKGTQGIVKLLEDYVVASLALLLVSPIMLLAAIAIRLDSPGPIMFKQWRPGFGQKPFAILKFRTMLVDPSDDGTLGTQSRSDPRITRVGGLLRRLSIDELPQLINVLRGEMSIVGPRPYVANMKVGDERFHELVRQYAARHRIKPGLTGWAQANGMRSYALRSPENARKSIEMDIYYITNWSLWLDIRIMARTVVVGLAGKNVF